MDAAVAESHGDNGVTIALGDWNFRGSTELATAIGERTWSFCAPGAGKDVIAVHTRLGTQPP